MIEPRFDKFISYCPTTGCWIWTGSSTGNGYGQFWDSAKQKVVLSHRYAYESVKGPIPEGLELDHLCRLTQCCNPDHLEAVTRRENVLRSPIMSMKEVCPKGHPMGGDNLGIRPGKTNLPIPFCRSCKQESDRKRYWRKKAEGIRIGGRRNHGGGSNAKHT